MSNSSRIEIKIDQRPIADAAKKALRDLAKELNKESLRIIATPGYFESSDQDIIDTETLEKAQRVEKVSETEYRLVNDADQGKGIYASHVYNGHVTSAGNFVQGRPWMAAAVFVTKPSQYFEERLKKYLR
ncbi:hypothetical protein [Leptolyngbya sp. FACHB-16]|uniref:hypothetical protein n=1 Tax=unclassified Leptolyngbya TaxID=2650499 RepID=UPI001686F9C5|nr:hypothetical protein [Leptolyngbya sp. FACHB-16]MBD2156237.1 hypothetical protein [Leptolyngbya sp. FACHB-16]